MKNNLLFICKIAIFYIFSTNFMNAQTPEKMQTIDELAKEYVKLGLVIGQTDKDFVDAYYGPEELKPKETDIEVFLKKQYIEEIQSLKKKLYDYSMISSDIITINRAKWMIDQLTAYERRVRIFAGETSDFDKESLELFGVVAPTYSKEHFDKLLVELEAIVPGKGDLNIRIKEISDKFIIPENKLDIVFKAAIEEARKITKRYYKLPQEEIFTLEYVKGTSWSGYNWYKGNYNSLIQINTDLPIYIDRAIDLACHEGYPGHHIYNLLLEKNLYKDKGYLEISMYPLFSPQSLIAEGTANYGIEVAFPGNEKVKFTSDKLLPLAGLDTNGIDLYFRINELKNKLNFARNEVGRGIINKTMTHDEAKKWLNKYNFMNEEAAEKSIRFITKYRSYIINYNYGLELVGKYIERKGGTPEFRERRWEIFERLLSNQVRIEELIK
jgi:hypothetical protein